MVRQARLVINFLTIWLAFAACKQPENTLVLNAADPGFTQENGAVFYHGKSFSGTVFMLNDAKDTIQINRYRNGQLNGEQKAWYVKDRIKELRYFEDGKKTAVNYGYWENGAEKYCYTFKNDLFEGQQYEWYPDGRLFSKKSYKAGYENGLQQTFETDGKLRSNYEARNGRNYGNIGKKNCASALSDPVNFD